MGHLSFDPGTLPMYQHSGRASQLGIMKTRLIFAIFISPLARVGAQNTTMSGTTDYGDLIGCAAGVTSCAGATQISLTASTNVFQGTPFMHVLTA